MIKFLKGILFNEYKIEFSIMDLIDTHLDDYYTKKDRSIVDPYSRNRLYILGEYDLGYDKRIDLCIAPDTFPRVDCLEYDEGDKKHRFVLMIIPEQWYRAMGKLDRFALIHFLLTETIYANNDICLYEKSEKDIKKLCKPLPYLLSPYTSELINVKISSYNELKNEDKVAPQIYHANIKFTNIREVE